MFNTFMDSADKDKDKNLSWLTITYTRIYKNFQDNLYRLLDLRRQKKSITSIAHNDTVILKIKYQFIKAWYVKRRLSQLKLTHSQSHNYN